MSPTTIIYEMVDNDNFDFDDDLKGRSCFLLDGIYQCLSVFITNQKSFSLATRKDGN